jgi:hypothetical protein
MNPARTGLPTRCKALPSGNSRALVPRDCSAEVGAFNAARAEKRGLDSRSIYFGPVNVSQFRFVLTVFAHDCSRPPAFWRPTLPKVDFLSTRFVNS